MKSLLVSTLSAALLSAGAAAAQSTNAPSDAATPQAHAADAGGFIQQQTPGLVRAPKLVGVVVYGSDNKTLGKIDDILLDHDGSVKAIVIGVGGFLGIGKKDVALPYSAIHWQTERRTVATDANPPAGGVGGATTPGNRPATKTIDPAATEAYQGYPDKAMVQYTQAQLKDAPEFKYASNPETQAGPGPAPGAAPPAQKP